MSRLRHRLIAVAGAVVVLGAGMVGWGWLGQGQGDQAVAGAEGPAPLTVVPDAMPLLKARLDDLAARDQFMGVVLVTKGDQLLLRQAYGMADRAARAPLEPTSRFRLASVSKQFTAAAILRLQDDGVLSVDDPVCRWITPCPQGWETLRLSHLMSHTSGLPDLMDRPGWGERRGAHATLDDLTADTMLYRPRYEPGSKATYNNAGFNLLAAVVEKASGLPLDAYLRQAFFDRLGMADTGSDIDDSGHGIVKGYVQYPGGKSERTNANVSIIPGAGALYSTADDMLKWERALHGGHLLSQQSYAQMITDHAPADQGLRPGARPRGWGYGLFTSDLGTGAVPEFSAPQIYHTGSWAGFRNLVSWEPDEQIAVVVLTNDYHQRDQVFLIVQQAMAEAMGRPFPTGLKS